MKKRIVLILFFCVVHSKKVLVQDRKMLGYSNVLENSVNVLIDNLEIVKKQSTQAVRKSFKSLQELIRKNYLYNSNLTDEQRAVRFGTDISKDEKEFLSHRMVKVQSSLQKNFNIQTPIKMGAVFAGGGNRAMLTSLGFLLGAEEIGLYDSLLYMAGLSGSTWTICPFSYLSATKNMTLQEFKDQLIGRLKRVFIPIAPGLLIHKFNSFEQGNFKDNILKRFSYNQYVSSIDIYASFIGDYTLLPVGTNRLDVQWSTIAPIIKNGNIPMPIGSAVSFEGRVNNETQYYWYEISPFEVGSDQVGGYVPLQSFGSKYKQGKVVSGFAGHAPEYPLSFFQGVFGSAFTLNMHEYLDHKGDIVLFKTSNFTLKLSDIFNNKDIVESTRLSPATFHNYMFGVAESPLRNHKKIKLLDGGMNFNVPLPLLMRSSRNLDVIFIADSAIDLRSLQAAATYFKRQNIKFPDISLLREDDLKKPLVVLNHPHSDNYNIEIPTIMYCSFSKNEKFSPTFDPQICMEKDFCNMLNFNYTQEQAMMVIDLMRTNIVSVRDEIKDVLQGLSLKKYTKQKNNKIE